MNKILDQIKEDEPKDSSGLDSESSTCLFMAELNMMNRKLKSPKLRMDHLFGNSRHSFTLIYEDWLISSILMIKMNPLTISNKLDVCRVSYGYTTGTIFPHCTHTCVHHNPLWVIPALYCNSRSVEQNLQYQRYPWFFFSTFCTVTVCTSIKIQ